MPEFPSRRMDDAVRRRARLLACCLLLLAALRSGSAWVLPLQLERRAFRGARAPPRAIAADTGYLVVYSDKQGIRRLGLVEGPDPRAKKQWVVRDEEGRLARILSKAIVHLVSKRGSPAALASHAEAAASMLAAADVEEVVEVAWEMLAGERATSVTLGDLSELLAGRPPRSILPPTPSLQTRRRVGGSLSA